MGPKPVISDVTGLRYERKKRFIVVRGAEIRPLYMSILIRPFFLIGEGKRSALGLISTVAFFYLCTHVKITEQWKSTLSYNLPRYHEFNASLLVFSG